MRKTQILSALAVSLVFLAGCKCNDSSVQDDDLPTIAEMELVSPVEASAQAEAQITEANVDLEYEKLLDELDD